MMEMKDQIRRLQKDGEYKFEGMSREQSKRAAEELARAAQLEDRKNGIESRFGVMRDAFGYYSAVQMN